MDTFKAQAIIFTSKTKPFPKSFQFVCSPVYTESSIAGMSCMAWLKFSKEGI